MKGPRVRITLLVGAAAIATSVGAWASVASASSQSGDSAQTSAQTDTTWTAGPVVIGPDGATVTDDNINNVMCGLHAGQVITPIRYSATPSAGNWLLVDVAHCGEGWVAKSNTTMAWKTAAKPMRWPTATRRLVFFGLQGVRSVRVSSHA